MHFDHSKKSYYRFPSKNSITEMDAQLPYYFPEKNTFTSGELSDSLLNVTINNTHDGLPTKGDIL